MPDSFEFLLPLYGDPALCRLAIASVLGQTRTDFRLTIVDDSFPGFPLAEHIRGLEDDRVDYRQNESVLGAGANFRRVLSAASADRVIFMGADDVLHPGYLEHVAELIARFPEVDVVQPGVRVIGADGLARGGLTDRVKRVISPRVSTPTTMAGESLAASLLRGNWTYFPSLCWRRSTIAAIGFREYDVVQDLGLLLDVVMGGGTLLVDSQVVFDYRRHQRSLSVVRAGTGARFDEEQAFLDDVTGSLRELGWRRAARSARWRPSSRLHAGLLASRTLPTDRAAAARLLRHALGR